MILSDRTWTRHANPWSVWTRYAAFPFLVAAAWSYHSIGWWSLAPIMAVVAFLIVNPKLFPPPRSTKSWAAKAVLGERVWSREHYRFPAQLHPKTNYAVIALSILNALALIYAIVSENMLAAAVSGIAVLAMKSWMNDRMVWLFSERMRDNREYASWLY